MYCPFCRCNEVEKFGILNAEKYTKLFGKDEYTLYEFKCVKCSKVFYIDSTQITL